MDIERLHRYLLSKPDTLEERPFVPEIPVYKVGGKMFAYLSPKESPPRITLKLEPLHGQLLRSSYPAVRPAYRMNKDHWNTVLLDGSISEEELLCWVDESYNLVVENLPHRKRARILRKSEPQPPSEPLA